MKRGSRCKKAVGFGWVLVAGFAHSSWDTTTTKAGLKIYISLALVLRSNIGCLTL